MNVLHIQRELPQGAKSYITRDVSQIKQIIVHHSASNGTPESIAKYHVNNNGWPGIGYHFMIDGKGIIYQTNDIDAISYHITKQNTKSLGICMIGNFETTSPNIDQLNALNWLIESLRAVIGDLPVFGHKDKDSTLCPGKNLYKVLPK